MTGAGISSLGGVRGGFVSILGVTTLLLRSGEAILAGAGGSGNEFLKLGMPFCFDGFLGDGDLSLLPLE